MPKFEVEWLINGNALIEADDLDEVEQIVQDSLRHLDTVPFEWFEVTDVITGKVDEATE